MIQPYLYMRLPTQPDETPITIFNPALEEFEFIYDQEKYKLAGYDFATHPKYLADRMASKLADWILSKWGIKQNYELDKRELLEKIYV